MSTISDLMSTTIGQPGPYKNTLLGRCMRAYEVARMLLEGASCERVAHLRRPALEPTSTRVGIYDLDPERHG